MRCPDCGAAVGAYHGPGCDWEDCPYCGLQLLGCEHSGNVPLDDRLRWTGRREAEKAAVALGWYAVLVPGRGWAPCDKGTPGSIPDLNRTLGSCDWDRGQKRFVPREG
jgi:hypothetical protein